MDPIDRQRMRYITVSLRSFAWLLVAQFMQIPYYWIFSVVPKLEGTLGDIVGISILLLPFCFLTWWIVSPVEDVIRALRKSPKINAQCLFIAEACVVLEAAFGFLGVLRLDGLAQGFCLVVLLAGVSGWVLIWRAY